MQIKKERKQTYRYSYTQLVAIKPAKAPGQDSIGTGGQNSIGANTHALQPERICVRKTELGSTFCDSATGELPRSLPKPTEHQRNS